MIVSKRPGYRGDTAGYSNPVGPDEAMVISDVFGPRPFDAHLGVTGYSYDFHRGVDFDGASEGDPHYAMTAGVVSRRNYSHFHWEQAENLEEFEETDPLGAMAVSVASGLLNLTCQRAGAASFPSQISRLTAKNAVIFTNKDSWVLEVELAASFSTSGAVGLSVFDDADSEYVALEYDGSTFRFRGAHDGGAFTADGTTYAVSGATWLRVEYDLGSDTLSWQYSSDGDAWTTLGTESGRTFTQVYWRPTLYWLSKDTNATPDVVSVEQLNWVDEEQTVGRFGNWITLSTRDGKAIQIHLATLEVELGQTVKAGQRIGIIGRTGFNGRSGRVNTLHIHAEISLFKDSAYDQDEATNPLDVDFLPRTNVSNNVTATVTNEADPDGTDSWRVRVVVARADSDFDLDAVSLTGNLASRSIGFNDRTGLNADNDIPLESGVYIVPEDFNGASATYECSFYFHRSAVGTTFVSGEVRDTKGILLTSLAFP